MDADVIVIGGGLAGLVATRELTRRGKKVAVIDQENAANLGGQAFWSFGGIFFVDSPEQCRMGVKDSFELAWSDWSGSAAFDRVEPLGPQPGRGLQTPRRRLRRRKRLGIAGGEDEHADR